VRALATALQLNAEQTAALLDAVPRREDARDEPAATMPVPQTSLIGRDHDVASVVALLKQGDVSLVTLTGPGGVGKTRLALSAVARIADEVPGGAWFVDLATIREPALVLPTIAQALGLRDVMGRGIGRRLSRMLREQRPLLLLDNVEQLIDAAPLLAELIAGAPGAKLLVTSRTRLRLSGEREYVVAPLALPARNDPRLMDSICDSPGVRLFVERAGAAQPGFALNQENAETIAEICRRVDGLPLAIELAAARVKLLPPAALLSRLGDRLPMLTGGHRDAPPRHQTMRETITWSFDLLREPEQLLFRRLAVFAGSFSLDAVEAVIGNTGVSPLDGLSTLLDMHLVYRVSAPSDEPRFGMLETIHEFAWQCLNESGEDATLRRAHADYFVALAERSHTWTGNEDYERLFTSLEPDLSNFRSALSWTFEQQEIETALSLIGALIPFWTARGHIAEGKRWLNQALARTDVDALSKIKPLLQEDLSVLFTFLSRLDESMRLVASAIEEALPRLRVQRETGAVIRALRIAAIWRFHLGDASGVRALYEEALALSRQIGDESRVGWTLVMLGSIHCYGSIDYPQPHDDFERAEAYSHEALAIFRRIGDRHGYVRAQHGLAFAAYKQRDYPRALALGQEVVAARLAMGLYHMLAASFHDLADLAGLHDQAELAARLYGAAEALGEAYDFDVAAGPFREEHEREVAITRNALDPDTFAAAWAAGRALSIEEAVELALTVHL